MCSSDLWMKEVFIHKFEDGVFHSEITLCKGESTINIDSRTSDAIAIALRTNCSIYTTEAIMRKCGIVLDENNNTDNNDTLPEELTADDLQDISKLKKQLHALKKKDIEERMAKAVEKEDYEFAKIYKDELIRREEEKKNNI